MKVFLSDCLYGMDLYKRYFVSEQAERVCIRNIINCFIEAHSVGENVGPIDIRKLQIDLENGDIDMPSGEQVCMMMASVDTLKYLPPEVLSGSSEWTVFSDLYLLALLLFSIEYFAFPFDGAITYEKPIIDVEYAQKIYSNPVFVFDILNPDNQMLGYNDGKAIELWDKSIRTVKEYYITNFTNGINSLDMRTPAKDTLSIFENMEKPGDNHVLEINGKKICLYEGLEVYEKDIDSACQTNDKLFVVIKSTKNENVLALGNTSNDTWSVYLPDSQEIMISPRSVAPIVRGAAISMGEYLANIM